CVSFMISRNWGSRWPSSGVAIAVSTRGWTSLGPGPRRTRGDGFNWPKRSMAFTHLQAIRKGDRKSTRLNSSHGSISYAVFCLKIPLPPPISTCLPYTTLFRSLRLVHDLKKLGIEMAEQRGSHRGQHARMDVTGPGAEKDARRRIQLAKTFHGIHPFTSYPKRRSEEHTSELQSR